MKTSTLLRIEQILKGLEDGCPKFIYGVQKNLIVLESILKAYKVTEAKISDLLKDYNSELEEARNPLILELGEEENGSKVIRPTSPKWGEYTEKYLPLSKAINEKYADVIEEYLQKIEELKPVLEEEIDFTPYVINVAYLPEKDGKSVISGRDMKILLEAGII